MAKKRKYVKSGKYVKRIDEGEDKMSVVEKIEQRPVRRRRTEFCDAKDPGVHVKLVSDKPKHRQYHERLGYEPIKADEIADFGGREAAVTPDGYVTFGDRVAMGCRRSEVERRERERLLETAEVEVATDEMYESETEDGFEGGGFEKYREHTPRRRGSKFYSMPSS